MILRSIYRFPTEAGWARSRFPLFCEAWSIVFWSMTTFTSNFWFSYHVFHCSARHDPLFFEACQLFTSNFWLCCLYNICTGGIPFLTTFSLPSSVPSILGQTSIFHSFYWDFPVSFWNFPLISHTDFSSIFFDFQSNRTLHRGYLNFLSELNVVYRISGNLLR